MIGITTAGIQAPSVNFETTTTTQHDAGGDAADGVDDQAPLPLRLAQSRGGGGTMPNWDSVKPVNTPTA